MRVDKENSYSEAQVVTASGLSTNKCKTGAKLGIGEPMCVVLTLDEAPKSSDGNETYKAKLQTDDAAAFGSGTDVGQEITIPRTAEAGTRYVIPIPPDSSLEDWTAVYYTLGGTNPSLTITSRVIPQKFLPNEVTYPSATVIN